VIFNGDPPFSLWEHPPRVGKIPPHRSDAGAFLLAECFGCADLTLVKDVDGLYDRDPKEDSSANLIDEITVAELSDRNLATLPFDRVILDLLASARQITSFQVINGLKPELLEPALSGKHVGTIVYQDSTR
jgi:molybdenum storage protein